MTHLIVLAACVWLAFTMLGGASAQEQTAADLEEVARLPTLVTFGPRAAPTEGDHDYQQIIRIELPIDSGEALLRIFDPDVGGQFDEPQKGFNSRTRFSIFGAGTTVQLHRDADGVVQEALSGEPLASSTFGHSESNDGKWVDVFTLTPSAGVVTGNSIQFYLLAEGVAGNDGNVFDVDLVAPSDRSVRLAGTRMFTYLPTFQAPADQTVKVEYRFKIPADAHALMIENFDAAGAGVFYESRFRQRALRSSEKSAWERERFVVFPRETNLPGAITTSAGEETPNDLTVFIGISKSRSGQGSAPDSVDNPIALELPPRFFRNKPRPSVVAKATALGCQLMELDATRSTDPDGGALSHRWRPAVDLPWQVGPTLRHQYKMPGVYLARLETSNVSRRVGNGSARNLRVVAKPAPTAAFDAPVRVAEQVGGTLLSFDGRASTAPNLPLGNTLTRMTWDFGDGNRLVQMAADPAFGTPAHRYASPGTYDVHLTVEDLPDHPCNNASTSHRVVINGRPVAVAGGDLVAVTGEPFVLDGSNSSDAEGPLTNFEWQLGSDETARGPLVHHTFHSAGTHPVTLTVRDNDATTPLTASDTITVRVADRPNEIPLADAGADRSTIVGKPLVFDALKSSDTDGNILLYRWDFGDGGTASAARVEHSFWAPGTYQVALEVEDTRGGDTGISHDTALIEVTERPITPARLDFPDHLRGTALVPLTFDASAATDSDGSVIRYDWIFGDGDIGTGVRIEHMYQSAGQYEARLRLTDNSLPVPAVSDYPFVVTIDYAENQPPSPRISVADTVVVGDPVAMDASLSTDADGSINVYRWDFGDGHASSGVATHHVYQFAGDYDITLTTTDDHPRQPRTVTTQHPIVVRARENAPPIADAGPPVVASVGEIIQLDGRGSSDPDGNIMAYLWEFGDGSRARHASPQHTFHDPGDYLVRLTVTDDGAPAKSTDALLSITVRTSR